MGNKIKSLRVLALAGGISVLSLTAMAAFTTSEFGKGGFVDGSSVGDILNNFLGTDGAQQIDLTDLSSLATALSSSDSFDYSSNASLALFDQNNDGEISEQEFVNILNGIGGLNSVDTSGNGIYAQAYATELAAMTSPVTLAQIQTAITTGNTYAVDAPQVQTTTLAFSGVDSSHSSSLGILDGLGNSLDNASANVITSFSASHASDSNASSRFDISSAGALTLASGTDIEDLEPGTYTISVTATDDNTLSYDREVTTDVSLTVSNERGCIVNNGIETANFSTGDNSSTIDNASVTISSDHNSIDKLFVRGATATAQNGGDVDYSSIPGYSSVTASFDKSSGELKFDGSLTLANWVEVFKLVGYIFDSDNSTDNGTRGFIFSLSSYIPFNHSDGNVHFYDYIAKSGIDFNVALDTADNSTLFGLQGYLATITSAEEQEYLTPKLNGKGWLGACDRLGLTSVRNNCNLTTTEVSNLAERPWDNTTGEHVYSDGEGYWYWVTGPERLDYMFRDIGNCTTAKLEELNKGTTNVKTYPLVGNSLDNDTNAFDFSNSEQPYVNMDACEPNNYTSGAGQYAENHMHFYSGSGDKNGKWNDYGNTTNVDGYIIEYGGMSGDPSVDLAENKTYNIATEGQFCAHQ